jgi:hypothetical protein
VGEGEEDGEKEENAKEEATKKILLILSRLFRSSISIEMHDVVD